MITRCDSCGHQRHVKVKLVEIPGEEAGITLCRTPGCPCYHEWATDETNGAWFDPETTQRLRNAVQQVGDPWKDGMNL